jgi:AraC-like DNA-binding protein
VSPAPGRQGRLTLDPGGAITLRWTNAFRGLLTLGATDVRATHPQHVHDYYSICVVDRGEAEISCRGESYRVRPGSVILISPYEAHEEVSLSSGGWSLRALNPAPQTMRRVLGGGVDLEALRFISPVIHDAETADCLDRLFHQSAQASDGSISERLTERVRSVIRRQLCSIDAARHFRGQRAVDVARARILHSHRRMTSMTELAGITGMSRFHLSRIFRDATGLPPYQYFEQVRIARAKVMLRQGYSLSEVAMGLGFSDQSHFHRQFRDVGATTPGRYARAVRDVFCPRA